MHPDHEIVGDGLHVATETPGLEVLNKEPPILASSEVELSKFRTKKKLFGLRSSTLILIVLLAISLLGVIAASIAGGVSVRNAKDACAASDATVTSDAATSSPESTPNDSCPDSTDSVADPSSPDFVYTPPLIENVTKLALDCPNIDQEVYQARFSTTFSVSCGSDHPLGWKAVSENGTESVQDLAFLVAWSLRDCMELCAGYNRGSAREQCRAVTFSSAPKRDMPRYEGNCWLKNAPAESPKAMDNDVASATMIGSS